MPRTRTTAAGQSDRPNLYGRLEPELDAAMLAIATERKEAVAIPAREALRAYIEAPDDEHYWEENATARTKDFFVRVEPELDAAYRALAAKRNEPVSYFVRQALRRYVQKHSSSEKSWV